MNAERYRVAGFLAVALWGVGPASAAPTAAEFQGMYDSLEKVKPEPGMETAKAGPPTWCAEVKIPGTRWTPQNQITIRADTSLDRLLDSARFTCLWPNEPNVQKAVGLIMQWYVNYTGLSLARATDTFKARISNKVIETGGSGEDGKDRFTQQQIQLCAALTMPKEMGGGEEIEFMTARRRFFGCDDQPPMFAPLWMSSSYEVEDTVVPFLESSLVEVDEVVRLAFLVSRVRYIFAADRSDLDVRLTRYITDQIDFELLSEAKLMKLLDAPPYKGNGFARTIFIESLAVAQLGIRMIKAEVAKRATDADWKELLITAPQRGIAEWTKASAQYKDVLARSVAFEAKFFGPSKKALKGCWPALYKDFVDVAKTLKCGTAAELQSSLSGSVPSLLLSRLVACASIDADPALTGALRNIEKKVQFRRGVRSAAFYPALDAIQQIVADRDKFPVSAENLRTFNSWMFRERLFEKPVLVSVARGETKYPNISIDQEAGTVKSVKKVGDNLQVTFVITKTKFMARSCSNTNRIALWDGNGSPVYHQECKNLGMSEYTSSPDDVLIPTAWADGIKPGVSMDFDVGPYKLPNRFGLPREVYTDKSRKTLVNYFGIGL